MPLVDLIILALATWRIASLLVDETGPADCLEALRYRLGIRYDDKSERVVRHVIQRPAWLGRLQYRVAEELMCIWCTSLWVGLALALLYFAAPGAAPWLALPFALSAAAVWVHARGVRARKREW